MKRNTVPHDPDIFHSPQGMFDLAAKTETLKHIDFRLLIAWALIFSTGISIWGCAEDQSGAAPPISGPSLVDRIHSAEELQLLLDSAEQPVLVLEFYADWCEPCRDVAPILESIAREASPQVKVVKINIDENRSLANRYRVRGIPTVVFIRGQKLVGSLLGVQPKRKYLEMIRKASSPNIE